MKYPTTADVNSRADLARTCDADLWQLRATAATQAADSKQYPAEVAHAARVLTWLRAEVADRALQQLAEDEHAAALTLLHQAERLGVHHHLTGGGYDQLHQARLLIVHGRVHRTQARHLVAEVVATLTTELATLDAEVMA